MRKRIRWVWLVISVAAFGLGVALSMWLYPEWRQSLQGWLTVMGLVAVGVATVIPVVRGLFESDGSAAAIRTQVNHRNEATVGAAARVGQVGVAGRDVVQNFYENNYDSSAREEQDARFSIKAPTNLFTGREAECKRLMEQLESARGATISDSARLGNVAGMGGVGKTELARYVAHQLREKYPNAFEIDLLGTANTPMGTTAAMGQILRAFIGKGEAVAEDDAGIAPQ